MRIAYYIIGTLATVFALAIAIATQLSKMTPLSGYSVATALVLGATAHFVAAARNYRGHWAFVTGITLATLAFASLGAGMDDWVSGQDREDIPFALFLIVTFLVFSGLTLWSSHKLHRCTLELERLRQKGTAPSNFTSLSSAGGEGRGEEAP